MHPDAAASTFDLTKQISSSSTMLHKRLFPALWFGVTLVSAVFGAFAVLGEGFSRGVFAYLAIPTALAVIGQLVMRKLIWDLVDEVRDGGDYLIIRKGDVEERVPLTNIMNVSYSHATSPPRVTLRMVKPGKFGEDVPFIPIRDRPFSLSARNVRVDDLIVRVDRARTRRLY